MVEVSYLNSAHSYHLADSVLKADSFVKNEREREREREKIQLGEHFTFEYTSTRTLDPRLVSPDQNPKPPIFFLCHKIETEQTPFKWSLSLTLTASVSATAVAFRNRFSINPRCQFLVVRSVPHRDLRFKR